MGGLRFVITRPAVVAAWVIGAAALLWLFIVDGRENGRDVVAQLPVLLSIAVSAGLGFALFVVPPVFFLVRLRQPDLDFSPPKNQEVVWTGPMNHLLHGESRGGLATSCAAQSLRSGADPPDTHLFV